MVCKYIGTTSVEDSNRFLRKLWSELDLINKNGWNFQPHRVGHMITIGWCNFGLVKFDYKIKGSINNIYFETDENTEAIEAAIDSALRGYNDPSQFIIGLRIKSKRGVKLSSCKYEDISIVSKGDWSEIIFPMDAFPYLDLKDMVIQKINPILYILYAYTHHEFFCDSYSETEQSSPDQDEYCEKYDYDWIDVDECPADEQGFLIVPKECLLLIGKIVAAEYYGPNLQLLINSGQLMYYSNRMFMDILSNGRNNQTGYIDVANAVLVSALEPLSNIGADAPRHCPDCGNLVYSIVNKLRLLTSKYLPEHIVKDICNRTYKKRSAFLHEGHAMTAKYYSGSCFPQINIKKPNTMYPAQSYLEYNLKDYVTYVFRNFSKDLLEKDML